MDTVKNQSRTLVSFAILDETHGVALAPVSFKHKSVYSPWALLPLEAQLSVAPWTL